MRSPWRSQTTRRRHCPVLALVPVQEQLEVESEDLREDL
jgi:hypothetical protein